MTTDPGTPPEQTAQEDPIPLTDSNLEAAAYLCLHAAAHTDLDQGPFALGELQHKNHHARRRRFEEARKRLASGVAQVADLGLTADDLQWAANLAHRARDAEGWRRNFTEAAARLPTPDTQTS